MRKKRLGKEWQNTYVIEFLQQVNTKRLLAVLATLDMISVRDVKDLWPMEELKSSDPYFNTLCEKMNRIAPEGCTFQVKNSYHKSDGERLLKNIKIGFYV